MSKIKLWLMIAAGYLSVVGLITFSLFILEESIQTTIFGTWPARNVNQWHIVLKGTDTMRVMNRTMKIINYSVGWLQPFAFFSYRAYSQATDFYIIGAESEIFAHEPKLFIGRHVQFAFKPKTIEALENGFLLKNNKISIFYNQRPELGKIILNGVLKQKGAYLTVTK